MPQLLATVCSMAQWMNHVFIGVCNDEHYTKTMQLLSQAHIQHHVSLSSSTPPTHTHTTHTHDTRHT